MNDVAIKIGDVVRLKSGGPPMVINKHGKSTSVVEVSSVDRFECAWIDAEGGAWCAEFHVATLVK